MHNPIGQSTGHSAGSSRSKRVEDSARGVVVLGAEVETSRGWRYEVCLQRPGLGQTDHVVTLSWVDHEHWGGGTVAPSRVIEAVLRYAIEHDQDKVPGADELWPTNFDAARVRRWFPRMDEELSIGA